MQRTRATPTRSTHIRNDPTANYSISSTQIEFSDDSLISDDKGPSKPPMAMETEHSDCTYVTIDSRQTVIKCDECPGEHLYCTPTDSSCQGFIQWCPLCIHKHGFPTHHSFIRNCYHCMYPALAHAKFKCFICDELHLPCPKARLSHCKQFWH